jgi:hypothetical protein
MSVAALVPINIPLLFQERYYDLITRLNYEKTSSTTPKYGPSAMPFGLSEAIGKTS